MAMAANLEQRVTVATACATAAAATVNRSERNPLLLSSVLMYTDVRETVRGIIVF
jgi:hypothetical protein